MGAAATKVAVRRQTDPVSLRRLVDDDPNWITMKALEKARERRYASVSDLVRFDPFGQNWRAKVSFTTTTGGRLQAVAITQEPARALMVSR
jgi:hypothetical protein